ncbi:glycosyltransferase family 4 protein [Rudaeicoccus suwonensis]|uniref:Uncharacterized protein n=1 Tax=Rudaeicoccus suwonensis TaxID=657409 RepID=A0A561E878_9MICO|nr:glycosyltransferase family 4 protein [Rudaeicoccus suwonensis]TWE11822.1 hypothetical protein BKA23_0609 [Rudaeicoccus suwonensis]
MRMPQRPVRRSRRSHGGSGEPSVLIAHPSADLYGADLQLLESVTGLVDAGWRVVVAMPDTGPLQALLEQRGAEVAIARFPVLRRAYASPRGIVHLAGASGRALPALVHLVRSVDPAVIVVNTATLPWWQLLARICRVPVLVHVHEAETEDRWAIRFLLTAPLMLSTSVVVNSRSSAAAACDAVPLLRSRIRLVYNGVLGPDHQLDSAPDGPLRAVVVCRLSPRKAPDVALEAMALVRAAGVDADLEVCGTAFEGYEWFEEQLTSRAEQVPLTGHVIWSGYVSPIWPALQRAHVVLAPSLREPFGNAVVEAQLAGRPVIAAAAHGHLETVEDGETGLLVAPGDAQALADAVVRLDADPQLRLRLAQQGRRSAEARFSVARYRTEFASAVADIARRRVQLTAAEPTTSDPPATRGAATASSHR